jgi:thiol-disulfide isomerase/thioredoxin
MYRRDSILVILAALLWPVVALGGLKEGDDLPDLTTFHLEGKLPEGLKGRVVLVDFWASWCGPCKASVPAMEGLAKAYAEKGLVVVAVSVDEKRENVERFLNSVKVSFGVLRDPRHELVGAADVRTMPTSFLVDRAGKIRFVHAGFDRERTPRAYVKEIEQLLREDKR